MYFTSGGDRAFESLMQGKPGFDHYDSGDAGAPEDCGDCRFYRPDWKYQFCVYAECPYQPGKLTAYDAVLFQVKGVDDEMAVFRVEKNRGYKSLVFTGIKDRHGIYAMIGKDENRDKEVRRPRASIRKQLSENKQAQAPKKAPARTKKNELEV